MSRYSGNTDNKFLQLNNTTLGVYNAWDTYNTARLALELLGDLKTQGHLAYYLGHVEELQDSVLAMQDRGLLLDRERRLRARRDLRLELSQTDRGIATARSGPVAGGARVPTSTFNPNSDDQVRRWLFEELDLRWRVKTDGGLPSVSLEALTWVLQNLRQRDEVHRPVLELLFHRSRLQTLLERYLDLEPGPDGRVRARVRMCGPKTFRFAYSEPALQQFPPELRHIFVAAPGYTFVEGDKSQLEARLLAHMSNDEASLAVFATGGDVHVANACDLFGWTPAQWPTLDPQIRAAARNFAKSFLYGISYGGAAETMKTKAYCPCPRCVDKVPPVLQLTRPQIREAENRWFLRHQPVRRFQERNGEEVRRTHHYAHPFGPRRRFLVPWGPELDRELKNLPMQMGGAVLMARDQIALHAMGAPIVLQMHDSFLLEVPEDDAAHWALVLQATMERPILELDGAPVVPTDIKCGSNWGGHHPQHNPTGMKRLEALTLP